MIAVQRLTSRVRLCGTRQRSWLGLPGKPRLIAGLAFLGLAAGAAWGQVSTNSPGKTDLADASLEQLMFQFKVQSVYAASKHEQKVTEAPSSVTIIDADEIKMYGDRNLAEVLESVRGLYISDDLNYTYLGVRGFNRPGDYNGQVLFLIDGHRLNENVFGSVLFANDFLLDVDLIDRIEVVRGPSSSIYGDNAFFGVINIVSKPPRQIDGFEATAEYGSFDTYKARFTYGKAFTNGMQLLLSGTYFDTPGPSSLYFPAYNTPSNNVNHGVTRDTDYERAYNAFGSLTYNDLTAEAAFNSRTKGVPTASYGTIFDNSHFNTTDNRAFLDLKYQRAFDQDWELLVRGSYDNYYYYGHYPLLYPPNTYVMYQDYAYGNWWTADAQLSKTLFDRHTLTAGVEFVDNFNQDQGNHDNYAATDVWNNHQTSTKSAIFGQADIHVFTNLIFNGGVRYDYFSTFGGTVNPRLGLIYNPLDATTLKALYGTAFEAPTVYEMYYAGPSNEGNPGLKPETIATYELVLEQGIGQHLNFILDGFYYKVNDLINLQTDPADNLLQYRNVDQVTAKGVEVELDGTFAHGLRGRASYSFQQTRDLATGQELTDSPEHQVKFNLIAPLWRDRLFLGLQAQASSSAETLAGAHADGFWTANVTLFSQKIVKNLEFSAGIYNLFDEKYYYPGRPEDAPIDKIPQEGRTFRLKLTYRF